MINLIIHAIGTVVIGYILGASGKEPSVMMWALIAKCSRCIDPDEPEKEQVTDAEVQIAGEYDNNLTGF